MPKVTEAGRRALDELLVRVLFHLQQTSHELTTWDQDETAKGGRLPGFVLAVSNIDEEIYVKGGGRHNHDDPSSREADPDSVFWICSMTKLITAVRSGATTGFTVANVRLPRSQLSS
jgi:CubicO group peptidase (beta-lactamase class C family)